MLTVLCGLPGSGKTTWRHAHAGDALVVCLDEIREEITGDASCQRYNENVVMVAVGRTKDALDEGSDVIIDATNLTREHRGKWIELAADFDHSVRCLYFPVDLETALRRNEQRARRVPAQAMHRMAQRLQEPSLDEGFDELVEITDAEVATLLPKNADAAALPG